MKKGGLTAQRPWRPVRISDHRRLAAILRGQGAALQKSQNEVFDLDGEAWIELLAEYRRRIAAAAGVDPSQVKITVGH